MFRIAAALTILGLTLHTRVTSTRARLTRHGNDAGVTSLEIAAIAVGLFLLAGVVVVIFGQAVQSATENIR